MLYLNLFLLALLIRLVYFYLLKQTPILSVLILDSEYYYHWAVKILSNGIMGDKIFFTEPLYAYLLALFLKISEQGPLVMVGLQILLGSILPIIIFKIAKLLFNRPVAIISGVLTALYGPFIFYDHLLLKTSLEVFLLSLFVLAVLNLFTGSTRAEPSRTLRRNTRKINNIFNYLKFRNYFIIKNLKFKIISQYFIAGLLLGIIVLIKGNSLILLPLVLYFILLEVEPLKRFNLRTILHNIKLIQGYRAILFLIGFFIVILPITIRNYIVGHDFVLTNYSFGMNVYQGNWWDGDGSLLQPPFMRPHPDHEEIDSYKMAEAYMDKDLKPSQVSSFWLSKGVSEILEDPVRWTSLMFKKVILFITPVELSDNYDYYLFRQFIPLLHVLPNLLIVIPFALFTILLMIVRFKYLDPQKKLFLLIIIFYSLSIMIGHVNSRYRLPVIPLLIILASAGIWLLYRKIKQNQMQKLGSALAILFVLFLTCNIYLDNFRFINDANFYNSLASLHMDRGDQALAEEYYGKATRADPENAWPYSGLFNLYLKQGEFTLAKEYLQKYIKLRPDDTGGYANLKLYKELKDKPIQVIQKRFASMKALEKTRNSSSYDPYFNEGMKYMKKGNFLQAEYYLQESASKFANPENTLLNLALIKKSLGELDESKDLLQIVIRRNKYFLPAKYNLANIYIREQNATDAARLLQEVYNDVPEFGETWYFLALSYLEAQDNEKAGPIITAFMNKYKIDPDPAKQRQIAYFRSLMVGENVKK